MRECVNVSLSHTDAHTNTLLISITSISMVIIVCDLRTMHSSHSLLDGWVDRWPYE